MSKVKTSDRKSVIVGNLASAVLFVLERLSVSITLVLARRIPRWP
jgi:hypothetical protein